ncbi:hypothetical protein JTE90_022706, partial [Oedothorax gibbosus]
KAELEAAQNYLEQAAQNNLPEFLKSLSSVLSCATNTPVARMAAGLQLKNTLTSKDQEIRQKYQERWLQFPADVRSYVKQNVLAALGTETHRPSSAAQCVAYIAVAELPRREWPDLIVLLTQNVTNATSTEMTKEATLEAIGYICQDIDPEVLVSQSNDILTAIVHGIRKDEPGDHVTVPPSMVASSDQAGPKDLPAADVAGPSDLPAADVAGPSDPIDYTLPAVFTIKKHVAPRTQGETVDYPAKIRTGIYHIIVTFQDLQSVPVQWWKM